MKKDRFKHWNTEPVKVKQAYKDPNYTIDEWELRMKVERLGCDIWDKSLYEHDFTKLELQGG